MAQEKWKTARTKEEERAALNSSEIRSWDDPRLKNLVKCNTTDFIPIVKGDKLVIPLDYRIYIGNFNGYDYLFTISEEGVRIPLSVFTRSVRDSKKFERVYTKGTAAEACKKFDTIEKFLDFVKGKVLYFKDMEIVETCYSGEPGKARIFTIDIL